MPDLSRTGLAALWLISLIVAGVAGGSAQAIVQRLLAQPTTPEVISGGDLGFRVDRWEDGEPVGAVVVQVDGEWVEVREAVRVRRVN